LAGHEPSFDDAVSYVGEYAGVRLCWIVDRDGLPIAVWQRQLYTGDADFWAPVSIEMIDFHRHRLSNGGDECQPDRLEVRTNQGRLVVESVRDMWLGVLTDPDADDLISVRITRAREMIARHLHAEGGPTVAAGEVQYV
jgi:predicted regulator of Ras-like GTPase activity (Roadblock/LC7/MglB family)